MVIPTIANGDPHYQCTEDACVLSGATLTFEYPAAASRILPPPSRSTRPKAILSSSTSISLLLDRLLYDWRETLSASPVQCYRPIHWVLHRQTAAPGLDQILLQREIPLRRAVRIINQHQSWMCFNPSDCRIIVSWSCRKKIFAKMRKIETGNGKFHAATKSIRHRSRRTGVTVARLENHSFPLRSISVRTFGSTKSIVVVTVSPVIFASNCTVRCSHSAGAGSSGTRSESAQTVSPFREY